MPPINTCAGGKDKADEPQFNPFRDRLDVALPCRLVREGFPHVRLEEQYSTHPELSKFPGRHFYDNKLRSNPRTDVELPKRVPGLRNALNKIIATYGIHDESARKEYLSADSDQAARLHWIQVSGTRTYDAQGSSSVPQHVDVFFDKILPGLLEFTKGRRGKLYDQVLVTTPYTFARDEYTRRMKMLAKAQSLTDDDLPRVETVQKSQGLRYTMVIFDTSLQDGKNVGFLNDPARLNVATTRATDVLWIIGGTLYGGDSLIGRYRDSLKAKGQLHHFTSGRVDRLIAPVRTTSISESKPVAAVKELPWDSAESDTEDEQV